MDFHGASYSRQISSNFFSRLVHFSFRYLEQLEATTRLQLLVVRVDLNSSMLELNSCSLSAGTIFEMGPQMAEIWQKMHKCDILFELQLL